jgi:hypothetical protein
MGFSTITRSAEDISTAIPLLLSCYEYDVGIENKLLTISRETFPPDCFIKRSINNFTPEQISNQGQSKPIRRMNSVTRWLLRHLVTISTLVGSLITSF